MHFEELWEKCEALHKDNAGQDNATALIEELSLKFNIYKVIDQRTDIPQEERQKMKIRVFGELLLSLTNLSLKDNINVYEALSQSYKMRSVEIYSKKYET